MKFIAKSVQDKIDEEAYGGFDILATRACYPESRRMALLLLKCYSEQYGVPFTVARITHIPMVMEWFDNEWSDYERFIIKMFAQQECSF